jgi:hypothetical protein
MLTLALQMQIYIKAERIPAVRAIASKCNSPGSKLGSERDTEKESVCPVFFLWLYSLPERKAY